jgi:hypothetical protein
MCMWRLDMDRLQEFVRLHPMEGGRCEVARATRSGPDSRVGVPDGADLHHRLDEAADALAETLLEMWRREQHARRAAAAEKVRREV